MHPDAAYTQGHKQVASDDGKAVKWIMKHRSCWTTSRPWASTLRCTLMGATGRHLSIAVAASHRMTAREAAGCPTTTP